VFGLRPQEYVAGGLRGYIQLVGRDRIFVPDAIVPVMAGAVVAAGVVVRGDPDTRHLALALGLAAAAALAARRRAPVATLAVSGCLVLTLFAVDSAAGTAAVFAPAVALYTVGLRRSRVRQLLAGVLALVAVVATDALLAGRNTVAPQTIGHAALVAVPLLAAETLRTRRSYVSLLLERLELAERTREHEARRLVERERLRIARDLHDVVAHTLTTINVQAGVAAHLLDRDLCHVRGALDTIELASREALDELRVVVGVLRDRDAAPLTPAPSIDDVRDLVEHSRALGHDIQLEIVGERPARLSDAVGVAAFRIVQESLTNIRRHAPHAAGSVRVGFEPDRLLVTVRNADLGGGGGGSGSSSGSGGGGAGAGLLGMTERALALGGDLVAGHDSGEFQVVATLPYRRNRAVE
jgi:signal transduction histidine kinase